LTLHKYLLTLHRSLIKVWNAKRGRLWPGGGGK